MLFVSLGIAIPGRGIGQDSSENVHEAAVLEALLALQVELDDCVSGPQVLTLNVDEGQFRGLESDRELSGAERSCLAHQLVRAGIPRQARVASLRFPLRSPPRPAASQAVHPEAVGSEASQPLLSDPPRQERLRAIVYVEAPEGRREAVSVAVREVAGRTADLVDAEEGFTTLRLIAPGVLRSGRATAEETTLLRERARVQALVLVIVRETQEGTLEAQMRILVGERMRQSDGVLDPDRLVESVEELSRRLRTPSDRAERAEPREDIAPNTSFAGVWRAGEYEIRFEAARSSVTGAFRHRDGGGEGTIRGTVRGSVLEGEWQDDAHRGRIRLELASDGISYRGTYGYDDGPLEHAWNGRRVGSASPEIGDDGATSESAEGSLDRFERPASASGTPRDRGRGRYSRMFAWTAADGDDDGLPDRADDCPSEAEVRNGLDDWDGCPDDSTLVDLFRHPFRAHFAVGYGIGLGSYREDTPPVAGVSMAVVLQIFGFELGPAFVIGSTKDVDGDIPWSRGIHFGLSPLALGPWRNGVRKKGFTFEPMIGLMSLWTRDPGYIDCTDWRRPETCYEEPDETDHRLFFTGGVRLYFRGVARVVGLEIRAVTGTNDALWLSFILGGGVLS